MITSEEFQPGVQPFAEWFQQKQEDLKVQQVTLVERYPDILLKPKYPHLVVDEAVLASLDQLALADPTDPQIEFVPYLLDYLALPRIFRDKHSSHKDRRAWRMAIGETDSASRRELEQHGLRTSKIDPIRHLCEHIVEYVLSENHPSRANLLDQLATINDRIFDPQTGKPTVHVDAPLIFKLRTVQMIRGLVCNTLVALATNGQE